jgi:hypothetical protein
MKYHIAWPLNYKDQRKFEFLVLTDRRKPYSHRLFLLHRPVLRLGQKKTERG